MKKRLKTSWTVCFATFVLCVSNVACGQDMEWQTDFATAMKMANAEKKMLLLHFTADWCRACKQLDTFVFNSQIVARDLQANMIPVKVDVDLHPELAEEYGVTKLPFDVVVTTSGRVVTQRPSPKTVSEYCNLGKNVTRMTTKIDEGTVSVAKSFEAIKQKLKPKKNPLLLDANDFKPTAPSHDSPGASNDGAALTTDAAQMANNVRKDMFFGQTPRPSQNSDTETKKIKNPHIGGDFQPATKVASNTEPPKTQPATQPFSPSTGQNKSSFDASLFPMKQNQTASSEFQINNKPDAATNVDGKLEQVQHTSSNSGMFPIKQAGAPSQTKATSPPKSLGTAAPVKNQLSSHQESNPPSVTAQTMNEINQANSGIAQKPVNTAKLIQPKPFSRKPENSFSTAKILKPQASVGTFKTQPTQMLGPKKTSSTKQRLTPKTTVQVAPKQSFGLKGKCPVTLLTQSQWVDGDERFGCVHRGRTYIFASKIHMKEFQSDPDRYSPLLAGYDPVSFHEKGVLVDGDESLGVFMGKTPNQRIVLFTNLEHKQRFQANPKIYIETIRQAMQASSNRARR